MKKALGFLSLAIAAIFSARLLMSAGCDGESNVGYHSVEIPWKSDGERLKDLSNGDAAIQYNTLCILDLKAGDMNNYLDRDSFRGSPARDTSLMIHEKVMTMMASQDPWVSSAAIRLLGNITFQKDIYFDRILRDNRPERNIQLEICHQLKSADIKDQALLRNKIIFLHMQKDWLLRCSAYGIVGMKDSCATDIFLDDFRNSADPDIRNLALMALAAHVDRSSFNVLAEAYEQASSEEVKTTILAGLLTSRDQDRALDWFFSKPKLVDSLMESIVESAADKNGPPICAKILVNALQKGWKPGTLPVNENEAIYPGEPLLYKELLEYKYSSQSNPDSVTITPNGKLVEAALLADPVLRKDWLKYESHMKPRKIPAVLEKEHLQLTNDYIARCKALIVRETGDTTLASNFEKSVWSEANTLYQTTFPKRQMKISVTLPTSN